MADKTILDLTTDTDRPVVKIDGIGYPLRTSNDLTLENFRFLERVSTRVGELLTSKKSLSTRDDAELEQRLKEIARLALEAPPAVHKKLTAIHRVMVFKVFTELLAPTLIQASGAAGVGPNLPASRLPGRKQSPGSFASTAGLLKPGRRGHRRA